MFVHELIYQGKPDSLAIVDHERRITYRELQQHVAACRDRLYAAGVRVGDRVSIFSRNSADYVYAYMAIVSLGAIAVPINFQLSSREIAYIIKDSGSRHILTYQPLNLVDALSTLRCDMRVTQHDIRPGKKKSRIEIEFYSEDDLERLLELLEGQKDAHPTPPEHFSV